MLLSLQFVYESILFYNNLTLETQVELLIPDSCFVLWVLVSGIHLTLLVRRVQQTILDQFAISRSPRGLQL